MSNTMRDVHIFGELAAYNLYQDEHGNIFLITQNMKVSVLNEDEFICHCFYRRRFLQLKERGKVYDVQNPDAPVIVFKSARENLYSLMISVGGCLTSEGKRELEQLLGHEISKYHVPWKVLRKLGNVDLTKRRKARKRR